ncbi:MULTISPECIES: DUF418 domain-containing protein [Pseudoalteromonas]|uniref:DUF418 domain-containing protein n=1 Tax=Pseudoalteromonas TaxID=53246 RepID=UPI002075C6FD|nr:MULTISPECIES: DUF418 domain-containing protein [Pseudoalteromonas]MDW7548572.1 DUF418 domain-containing protein [Pseudoalteromonas peptidolytica]
MKRIIVMDAIRGFALLGLLSMNLVHMANFELGYVAASPAHHLDPFFAMVNSIFFDGRFRSLFAMLFGAALCVQVANASSSEQAKIRLKWLLLFGMVHGVLIWPGDILFNYALSGFVALKFIDAQRAKLIRYTAGFIVLPALLLSLLLLVDPEASINRSSPEYLELVQRVPNTYWQLVVNNGLYFIIVSLLIPVITLWYTAGLMLLGMLLFKDGLFELNTREPTEKINLYAVLAIVLSFVGFVVERKVGIAFFEGIDWLLAIPVALFYIVVIKSVMRASRYKLYTMQVVGRLALTLYISQSIIFVSYFHFIQPEAISKWDRVDYFAAFVVATILQLVIANLYFKVFKQGPLEKLLKWLTLRRGGHD